MNSSEKQRQLPVKDKSSCSFSLNFILWF